MTAPPCLFRLPPTLRLPVGAVGVVGRGTLVFLVGLGLGQEEDEEHGEASWPATLGIWRFQLLFR